MSYEEIRTAIVSGLNAFTGLLVVEANSGAPRPAKPFLSYLFTIPLRPEAGLPAETGREVPSKCPCPQWEYDFEYTQTRQDTAVVSITAYSDDSDEAMVLAINAHSWFVFHGYDYLKENGLVVVNTSPVGNRDILLVDAWERRAGFDVTLRMVNEEKQTIPTIEKVELKVKFSEETEGN